MIEVVKCMPGTTVQDNGRSGYRRIGVGTAGALDQLALSVGNVLLGNDQSAPAIEILICPFEIRFGADCRFSVTGAAAKASLDGLVLPPWWCTQARKGQVLRLSGSPTGGIAYLCLQGGVSVHQVLHSSSTDLKGAFGGYEGRMLKTGDVLHFGQARGVPTTSSFGACPPERELLKSLRFMPGFEFEQLTSNARREFWSTEWTVSRQSNRIGYGLVGPVLDLGKNVELLSYAFLPGLMQLPPNGQPIVMLADAQTSGGYPRLGTVIESDLRLLAHSAAGTQVRLVECSVEEAAAAESADANYLTAVKRMREVICR
ncbi:5-oxoprolinase subunit C family protein [Pseudomonas sp. PSKL.D1]|uniref:5-oxoprolinase subunit C family protein n=1 Tax=Pseudomonas sp. PSKL.D1 TaxID=3029060 RepID=UPI0023816AAD|nr:biotin-dependent carboxyltransferase family protein [Pseudomonas sp. PSKL.D1]WDY55776.1 biotin-dependent carboxyltransferase family protein [Pseudomonas sp. PSKL.D1]